MTVHLTDPQRRRAERFNRRVVPPHTHHDEYVRALRTQVGLGAGGQLDGEFAQKLAEWQESNLPRLRGSRFDGRLQPRTEAHMGIPLDEMESLAQMVESYWREGGIFYDSWGNDDRDNDNDGETDERDEQGPDGGRYNQGQVYQGFHVKNLANGRQTRVAPVNGNYEYRFCSDIVARALRETRIVRGGYARVYQFNQGALNHVAYKFLRSDEYPEQYLRGDIIGHQDRRESLGGHGGHIGIVVQNDITNGGASAPLVIDLPGPTSQRAEGRYSVNGEYNDGRPAGVRGDIVRERWPMFRITDIDHDKQFLIRLVCTRLHRGRRPELPSSNARGSRAGG